MSIRNSASLEAILRQEESLRAIIESISSELELRPLLTRIVYHACQLLEADRGSIGLVDEDRQLVRTEAAYKMPPNELGAEMPLGIGLAGKVLATKEAVILNRYGDLETTPQTELVQDAVVGLPIFWHGQMIGFFGIGADPPRRFGEQDIDLLTLLARHAAIAIENARLFAAEKRRAVRQRTLARIGEIISGTLQLDDLLQTAVDAINEHLHYTDCGFLLIDNQNPKILRLVAHSGIYADHFPDNYTQSIHEGIIGTAARSRQPILIADVLNDERYLPIPGVKDIYTAISIPVIVGDQLLGVLVVESTERMDEEDLALLEVVGNQLGAAIVNARLFAAEKKRVAREVTLNRIGKSLAATLNLDDLLQTAITAIDEELSYKYTGVLLVDQDDPESLVLATARTRIFAENVPGPYYQSIHEGIIGEAARTRHPVLVPDVRQDPRYIPIPNTSDIRSELALPIINNNRLLGVLNVESSQTFDRHETADLELVADQLGVAITNAYFFEQLQRNLAETQLLYDTSRRMTNAFDVDDVIEAYLQHVAVWGRYVSTIVLYEFDENGKRTAVVTRGVWSPETGSQLLYEQMPFDSRDDLDPLLDQGQTVLMSDVHSDPRANEHLRRLQKESGRPALALIPLIVLRRRIGVVVLSYPTVHEWNESDLWPYQVTAAQLATAIDTRWQQLLLVRSSQEVAVLQDRQQLARELHDSVTQLIFSMTLVAQSVSPAWQRDEAEGQQRIDRLIELSQQALAEMRGLLFELRSTEMPRSQETSPLSTSFGLTLPGISSIKRDGLVDAFSNHIKSLKIEQPAISLAAENYTTQPLDTEVALFRIAQEGLYNALKYAEATAVSIRLKVDETAVSLEVQDDGCGFDFNNHSDESASGFGLRSMQERAEALNGRFKINSSSGRGTTLRISIPIVH